LRAIRHYAADQQILLVLDNGEHALRGSYEVAETSLTPTVGVASSLPSENPSRSTEVLWTLSPLLTRAQKTGMADATPEPSAAARLFLERPKR
jgi:hypothetical protein